MSGGLNLSVESTLVLSAPAKSHTLSIVAAVVGAVVLLAVFGVVLSLVYNNSTDGAASLFGYAVGQMLVGSLLLLLAKKKLNGWQRFCVACLLTSAYLLYDNSKDLLLAADMKEAQRIMAAEWPTDPTTLADEHPNNRMFRMISDAAKAAKAAQARFEALGNAIEPPILNEEIRSDAPRPKLVAYRDAARTAATNARAALAQVDVIYREEREAVRKTVSAYAPDDAISSTLGGVQRRQQRNGDANCRVLDARAALYDAIERSVAHLIDNDGQYNVDKSGQVVYASTERS